MLVRICICDSGNPASGGGVLGNPPVVFSSASTTNRHLVTIDAIYWSQKAQKWILPGLEPGASRNRLLLQTLSENRNH
jgi:hypothetical protein